MRKIRTLCLRFVLHAAFILLTTAIRPGPLPAGAPVVPISGTVVDAHGARLAGAEVFYAIWRPSQGWILSRGPIDMAAASFLTATTPKGEIPAVHCDDQGRFRLTVPQPTGPKDEAWWAVLWGYSPGHRIKYELLGKLSTPPAPVKLVLPPAGNVRFKILDPMGKPVPGAEVTVTGINRSEGEGGSTHDAAVPDPPDTVQRRLTAITDAEGFAAIPALSRWEVRTFDVAHPRFGTQGCQWEWSEPDDQCVRIRGAGRIRGRVVADKPELVRGLKVSVMTAKRGTSPREPMTKAAALVTTDAQGRFETPLLAEGAVGFEIPEIEKPQSGKPAYLLVPEYHDDLPAGTTRDVELRLQRTVRVHGAVREKGTGKPLAVQVYYCIRYKRPRGIQEHIAGGPVDKAGRFEFTDLPGEAHISLDWSWGGDLLIPLASPWHGVIPSDVAEVAVPPFELAKATGRVVDEAGKPLDEVLIECRWRRGRDHDDNHDHRATGTHDGGKYALWADPACELQATFHGKGLSTREIPWTSFGKLASAPLPDVVLRHESPIRREKLFGTVTDRQKIPVAGATVFWTPEKIVAGDSAAEYKPCQPMQVITDSRGRFALEGVPTKAFAVFAHQDGFRFYGQWVEEKAAGLEITLSRPGEPPRRILRTLPPPLARSQRVELAGRAMNVLVDRLLCRNENNGDFPPELLRLLPVLAPQQARALLAEKMMKNEKDEQVLRNGLQPQEDFALTVFVRWAAASCLTAEGRAAICLELSDVARQFDGKMSARVLQHGLREAREVGNAPRRLQLYGRIAQRLLDAGRGKEGTELFREGLVLAKTFSAAASEGERVDFAVRLARIDPSAARQLLIGMRDINHDRGVQEIAASLAGTMPAETERILNVLCQEDFVPGAGFVAVCVRMAGVDLPRARRLVLRISGRSLRAHAYALMAVAVRTSQPDEAVRLLHQAFDFEEVPPEGIAGLGQSMHGLFGGRTDTPSCAHYTYGSDGRRVLNFDDEKCNRATVAAALLPLVERVNPELLDEFLWKAISLREPPPWPDVQYGYGHDRIKAPAEADMPLAALLARYDRRAADNISASPARGVPRRRVCPGGGDRSSPCRGGHRKRPRRFLDR